MKIQRQRIAVVSACIASALLVACGGGGGGSGGIVRSPAPSAPPPAPPPPPLPPPPTQLGPCQMPITGDCVVNPGAVAMGGGRSSDHALHVRGGAHLFLGSIPNEQPFLAPGTYRFAGGTVVGDGESKNGLSVREANTLESNVQVNAESYLFLEGTVRGQVTNAGAVYFGGGILGGSLQNNGKVVADAGDPANTGRSIENRVEGAFRQGSGGTLSISLPSNSTYPDYRYTFNISGRADLDGTLELRAPSDGWDSYPFPTTPTAAHVLHAGGGVFGTFLRWTAPFLFVEGSLRYGSHDVWFDLTRASFAPTMASNGVSSALTLASAGNLDRLFVRTDGLALMAPGTRSDAQDRMLASAGSVLRIHDIAQATRTLDSLSGAMHADAMQASLRQGIGDPAVGQRLAAMQPGFAAGAWSKTDANGGVSGFDQWLSPRLLVGVQAGQGSDAARDTFGQSSRLSPQAGAYLRWFGDDGWYAGGSAGYAQHTLALDRTLDLDRGGQWNAHARHRFNVAGVQGEAGRRFAFAGGALTPYVALDATALRSERSLEQGRTGFELAMQSTIQAQMRANLGIRFGRDWRIGDTGWLRLDADARVQRRLADAGDPLRAAFVGVPDLWFDVPSHSNRTSGWLDVGLRGGIGRDWTWSLDRSRPLAGGRNSADAWRIGLLRTF